MSAVLALHDPVFRLYCSITVGALIGGGVLLSFLTLVLKKDVRNIWATYRSWLVMAAIVLGCVFIGRVGTIVLVWLLSMGGFKEYARATGLYRDWWMTGTTYVAILAVAIVSLLPQPPGGDPGPGWYGLFMTLPVFAIAMILVIPIIRNQVQGQLQKMSQATFTCGKLFGRHKLRSNISPNKTWEGALCALAVSLALPWMLRFSFPHFGTAQLVLTGLIVGIGGQLGDLSISVMKRDIGIKDMGVTIPGHGGVLDRIDSLIYVAPLFLHMVDYCYRIW